MSWASEVLADSPLVWWRQDDTSTAGDPMTDSSGNARHGTYTGFSKPNLSQPSLVPSDANLAANFNVDQGGINDAAWMDVATITLELWYKPANAPGSEEILFNRYSTTTAQRTWLMRRSAAGKLALYHYDTGGTQRVTTGATTLLQNVAYHLAATIDSSGNVVLYVDGVSDGTGTYGVAARSVSTANIRVGDYNGGTSQPADGILDEVAFYGTALSGARVLAHYTAATATPPNVPTSVSCTAQTTITLELTWSAPSGGGSVTSYDVRLDGGTPSTQTSPYVFTGLTPDTAYDLEVRAVGPGGTSSWVLVSASTEPGGPSVAYEASIRVGAHFWEIEVDDPGNLDGPEVLAGATFTWTAPDDQGWPPLPWVMPLDTLSMRLYAPTAEEVADIARGDIVRFKFTPEGYDYTEPLLDFAGRLSSEPQITDHPGPRGGVYVDLVAVDYRVDLVNTTIWGSEVSGTFAVIDTTENPYDLLITDDELPTDIDTLLAANHPDWPAGGMGNILDGTSVDGTTFPDYAGSTVLYGTTESASLWQIYRALGVFPWPNFDDDGDLIPGAPFRYIDVAFDGSDYETADPIDAALVPNPSWQWRRNYLPNIMETTGITGNPPRYQGGDYFEDPPTPPHIIRRSFSDLYGVGGDFNFYGFANEIPTDSPWGLYVFTVRAWTEPLAVQRFFTYPHRVRRLISVDNIAADKDPTGTGAVEGMLRGAQLVIAPEGRWFVTAGMRIAKPGPPPE